MESSPFPTELKLANWGKRFLAWIVDFFAIGIGFTELLHQILHLPRVAFQLHPLLPIPLGNIVLIAYWTLAEGLLGTSIGKYVFHLRATNLFGENSGLARALLQSIGKSFLAPIDLILGLSIPHLNVMRQRAFNRLSGTIVISKPAGSIRGPVLYVREK